MSMIEKTRMVDDEIHPCPSNIRYAMDLLEAEISNYHVGRDGNGGAYLMMADTGITRDECGTFACVGGWYALASIHHHNEPVYWEGDLEEEGQSLSRGYAYVGFREGADALAHDLGFKDSEDLTEWAIDWPEYWGNDFGGSMFHGVAAYAGTPSPANGPGIVDVIAHWRGVADRLEADELPSNQYR